MIDTSFALVDRLQKLYKIGMQNYLNKEITYYSKDDIKHAFTSDFNGVIIQEKVENIFNKLKYFQNGDFNFIEVYNKELFDENFKILLEIVKSLENMKFTHNEDANILGDYFETYIKDLPQQEGQYFTPVPIVNFIVYSIPVFKFNKVLDYACGAGHFLTQFFNKNKNAKSEFLGVEKDTRLSKISTIASFMNHAHSQMKIKSANSLSKGELQDSYFNVLISNPPYSVKGFLEVLSPKDREEFSLLSSSTIDKTDDIECYFIEKASRVLQTNGILALVLPNSLLNNSGIFEKTREILIRDFNIISICELGGGTFYKTTTSTMIIFAVRKEVCKDTITSQNDIYLDIYNLILNNKFDKALKTYKNLDEMLSKYCDFRSYNKDEFIKLLNLEINENSILFENENFKEYLNAYNNDILEKEYKAYEAKSDKYKRANPFNPSISENEFIRKIECEKLLYFCYCYDSNPIIIKSPKGAELKKFLGYEWSSSKGSEGIQILGDKLNTTLFNDDNRFDTNKLNFYILQEFLNKLDKDLLDEKFMSEYIEFKDIPSELEKYAFKANLCDLMDFSKPKFDKAISLEKREMAQMEIISKYPLVKFENITTSVGKGKRPASFENADGEIIFYKSSQEIYKCDTADFNFEALIIGDGGSANVHYHNGKFSSSDHTYIFTPKDNAVIKFVYYVLNSNLQILESKFSGISIKNISKTSINNLKIPLPPIDIQKQIVDECQSIDNQISTLNSEISEFQQKLQQMPKIISNIEQKPIKFISEYVTRRVAYKDTLSENYITTDNISQKYEGIIKYEGTPNIESAISYNKNDILISNIRPYLKKIWFSNQIGCCSTDVLVIRIKAGADCLAKYLFYCLRQDDFFNYSMKKVKGIKMPRGDKEHIMNYKIPLPPLEVQEKIVAEFEKIENEISIRKEKLESLKGAYSEILDRYLK